MSVEKAVWTVLFLLVPMSIAFVASLPLHYVEILVFVFGTGTSVGLYWVLRREDVEENLAITIALGLTSFVIFAVLLFFGHSLEVNVLGNYAPHFENIAAWAFPTLMWFQARVYLNGNEYAEPYSEETLDSLGFAVALFYTIIYSLMEANLSEPVEYLLVALLLLWLGYLFLQSVMRGDYQT